MRVALDDLKTEMVLGADIVDGSGRLLLPNGTVLSEKHIRYCQMWGIPDAEISAGTDGEGETEPVIDPARWALAESVVAPRFMHTDTAHPAIAVLYQHCVAAELKRQG